VGAWTLIVKFAAVYQLMPAHLVGIHLSWILPTPNVAVQILIIAKLVMLIRLNAAFAMMDSLLVKILLLADAIILIIANSA
jgi:hypothetical protein